MRPRAPGAADTKETDTAMIMYGPRPEAALQEEAPRRQEEICASEEDSRRTVENAEDLSPDADADAAPRTGRSVRPHDDTDSGANQSRGDPRGPRR